MTHPFGIFSFLCWIALVIPVVTRAADDNPAKGTETSKSYTQVPEIAPVTRRLETEPNRAVEQKLPDGPIPLWIWGASDDKNYTAQKTFTGKAKTAKIRASADNEFTLYLNGKKICHSHEWQTPIVIDVTQNLQDGENSIRAEITNHGGAAGFVFRLDLIDADGKSRTIVSDETWMVSVQKSKSAEVAARKVGKYGDAPWNDVFSGKTETSNKNEFHVPEGFQVEKLFTVPKNELGSWVCLTTDDKGRLIACDQGDRGLCRITPGKVGTNEPTTVERLDVKFEGKPLSHAQGLLHAFGALYLSMNGGGNGLYRLKDTNGDDQYDEVVKLKSINGGGEHGSHALRVSPDGKSILWVAGNHTLPPFERKLVNSEVQRMAGVRPKQLRASLPENAASRLAPIWDEDLLLPREWDAGGHAVGVMAPGGWIAKTDPDGKTWEIISSGFRNQYDIAINADGEIFAYDADMEWDLGASWYRPTRVNHATSGSEFGWRSGSAKWPAYFVDSLPEVVDIGPGSPVGVEFGYGAKFPAKFQKALFLCDWTFGTMYAVHMEPVGSSYKGVREEFVGRNALPLTDVVIGKDGAMYFTVGGRGAQSDLYRVTYVGPESTAPVNAHDAKGAAERALRREIETYHQPGRDPAKGVPFLVKNLGHSDRFIRYAARVGLEHLPSNSWLNAVLDSSDPETVITGIVGLARVVDSEQGPELIARLRKLNFAKLDQTLQIEALRAYQLTLLRCGLPDAPPELPAADPNTPPKPIDYSKHPAAGPKTRELGAYFEQFFPSTSEPINRELAVLMIALESPRAAEILVPILARDRVESTPAWAMPEVLGRNPGYGKSVSGMLGNQPDQLQSHLAFNLRHLKSGWTIETRKIYFAWFDKARAWSGGNSFQKYFSNVDNQVFDSLPDNVKVLVTASGARKPYKAPALPKPVGPGKDYTLDEVVELASNKLKQRDFDNGKKMFAAARCVVCHRFAAEGGATGPDLTQLAGRFNIKDLTESIIDPSKVVSDQYKTTQVETKFGKQYTGRVVSAEKDSITLLVDPEDATKLVTIALSDIEQQQLSPTSLMPKDLLKTLNEDEVLDLMAYLVSRGNKGESFFKKK